MSLAVRDGWLHTRLVEKEAVAEGIARFVLRAADDRPLPVFTAGAHIEVELPAGVVRPYSLCNSPLECDRYEIAVLRDPNSRGGSRSAHDDLRVGQTVRVRPPRNLFPLVDDGHAVLIAGGIGVTPLLAMAQQLAAARRDFTLHYTVRAKVRAAFLDRLACPSLAGRTRLYFDDADGAPVFDAVAALAAAPAGSHLYVCGPQGFMDHVIATARRAGWPEERIHFEYFAVAPTTRIDGGSFELVLARSGVTVPVAADQTAAQALQARGLPVRVVCEQGICGSCALPVLEGEPDHRDSCLTRAERAANKRFTPCCSRARSPRLVVDL